MIFIQWNTFEKRHAHCINPLRQGEAYASVNLAIICLDNGILPDWHQAISNQCRYIVHLTHGISVQYESFSYKKINAKISSAKWQPFCLGLSVHIFYPLSDLPRHRIQSWRPWGLVDGPQWVLKRLHCTAPWWMGPFYQGHSAADGWERQTETDPDQETRKRRYIEVTNSLASGRCGCNLKSVILKFISSINILSISCEICPEVNATRPHWWLGNIGSGNGLMPSFY